MNKRKYDTGDYDELVLMLDEDKTLTLALTDNILDGVFRFQGVCYSYGDTEYYSTPDISIIDLFEFLKNKEKYDNKIKKDVKESEAKRFTELRAKYEGYINDNKKLKDTISMQKEMIENLEKSLLIRKKLDGKNE